MHFSGTFFSNASSQMIDKTDNNIPLADRPPRPATVERMLRRAKSVDLGDEEADVG